MSGRASRRSRRASRFSAAHLAGWLFADLMLVLFLVAMAVQRPAEIPPDPRGADRPTPQGPRVLGQDFCEFMIPVQADGLLGGDRAATADLLAKVDRAVDGRRRSWLHGPEMRDADGRARCEAQLGEDAQVGFYLVYGARDDTDSGVILGRNAAKAIKSGDPRFRAAIYRAAWTGGAGNSAVQLIVFFYQN
ncbi:hypothetical protein D0T12_28885 [Actinomadura spongiicola]|uniref:Uncharacterized protein n=1 Tax=Actinomadura spongiicola TaxID=2303421 RepID=A0A372GAS3_9ACTN|nr:hypothetical protein [Actinomadura spongiicola]RFS82252.1 hypothetical protein D0T12_28885 [Actinomadura spongiicola]